MYHLKELGRLSQLNAFLLSCISILKMKNTHKQFQEAFDELLKLPISEKIKFLEELLFYFTLTGRGIWMDEKSSDTEKLEAFKWLNELMHRIWNRRIELQGNKDNDSITNLYENMKFYGEQSDLLREHLVPTFLGAFINYKKNI
jgi:hypothetical protein